MDKKDEIEVQENEKKEKGSLTWVILFAVLIVLVIACIVVIKVIPHE